jgi:hypothetical protein
MLSPSPPADRKEMQAFLGLSGGMISFLFETHHSQIPHVNSPHAPFGA